MRLKGVVAAMVCCLFAMFGISASASADPPVIRDLYGWSDGNVTQNDTDAVTWSSSGGGDYERRDECDIDMLGSCGLFPGTAAPIIRADASGTYPVGSKATWTYTVPGGPDTYIKNVVAGGISVTGESELTLETGEPSAFVGVWNGTTWSAFDSIDVTDATSVEYDGEVGDRQVKFGLQADSTPSFLEDHWAGLAAVIATLGDDERPTQTIDPMDVPSGWVDETPIDIPVEAEDDGLGLANLTAVGPKRNPANPFDWYTEQESFGCVGNSDDPCPLETAPGTEITIEPALMREGHTIVTIAAMDPAENFAEQGVEDHDLKIDTKDPVVSLGGSFTTAPGMVLDGPLYALDSDAVDGNLTVANSGVVKIEVLVDDVVIDSDTQSCSTENCTLGLDTDIEPDNYTNGAHVLKVKATDAVGHVKTETVPFEVDR